MNLLVQKILEKEPAAIYMAKEFGSFASQSIKPLVSNEDSGVRQIAIRCLNQSGGYGVSQVFANALLDKYPSVRAAALSGLENHLDSETYPQLLKIYNKVTEPQHRQELALILAKFNEANINDLKNIFENEKNPEALEGCMVALAKLGDKKSKEEFLNILRNSKDRQLKRFLEYAEYIEQVWVLLGLESILNNKSPLDGIGFCSYRKGAENKQDEFPEYLRACDMAVNLIAKIIGNRFPFPVNGAKNYAEEELAEAKSFLYQLFSR